MKIQKILSCIVILFLLGLGLGYVIYATRHKLSSNPQMVISDETTGDAEVATAQEDQSPFDSSQGSNSAQEPASSPPSSPTPTQINKVTVAWQPSHQDDTGDSNWHEYIICGDIVDRTATLATGVNNVKCWDISHGLTGTNNYRPQPTNTVAFDNEVAAANASAADYFIAVHNDGGAPSGILGECLPGDTLSRQYLQQFMTALCTATGLPNRGINEVRLYSLETTRNKAPVRILLEIGDNVNNREQLESLDFRQLVAKTLAEVADSLPDQH